MTSDLEQIAEALDRFRDIHGSGYSEIHGAADAIRAWIAANKESEASLRMILWLEHGHQGLYGDDGEMQCNTCVVDYKHQPMARLIDAWNASRRERQVSEARAARPQRKAFVEAAIEYAANPRIELDAIHYRKMFEAYRAMIEAEKVEAE